MGPHSPTSPATPNSTGQSPRAAVLKSDARAEASRRNGARSRGPGTAEGKARSAQNALKHGVRAQREVPLPDEDAAEFQALEAALVAELAPVGALQTVRVRRFVVAAWRLARADRLAAGTGLAPRSPTRRQQAEKLEQRGWDAAGPGLALIRGPRVQPEDLAPAASRRLAGASTDLGCRCAPTNRYRGAAIAEFWRALRTLKALQAEQAAATGQSLAARPRPPAVSSPLAH